MKNLMVVICVMLAVSVGVNVWFLSGKGIVINQDKRITNNNSNYQQQWQGQLLINQFMTQGNTIEWRMISVKDDENLKILLNGLHPISSFYSQIILAGKIGSAYLVIYPDIFTKTKEEKK